jgi:hypothetical protein
VSAYAKSGNADMPGFHARSIAGGLFTGDQWIYFAFIINWYAQTGDDPDNASERFYPKANQRVVVVGEWSSDFVD